MPDDAVKEEVTGQAEGTAESTEEAQGFAGGFGDEVSGKKDTAEAEVKPEEKPKKEAKPSKKVKAEPKVAEKPPETKGPTEGKPSEVPKKKEEPPVEDVGEEDESELRGKELYEAEQKADKERLESEKAEAAAKEKTRPEGKFTPFPEVTPDLASAYLGFAMMDQLPETVKVGDNEYALREYAQANPEAAIIAGTVAANIIQRLLDQGILLDSRSQQTAISGVQGTVQEQMFDLSVRMELPGYNPTKIWDTKEFQDWHKEAPETIKALFRSSEPSDHAKGFKRFLAKATKETTEKTKEHDTKLAGAKKVHDDIHSNTIRSGGKPTGIPEALGDAEEEFHAGFEAEK